MPPAKASRAHDDAKGEGTHTEKKNGGGSGSAKMRRITSQTSNAASHREAAIAPTSAVAGAATEQTAPGVSCSNISQIVHGPHQTLMLTSALFVARLALFRSNRPPLLPARTPPHNPELLREHVSPLGTLKS